jgi:hypothetical protein
VRWVAGEQHSTQGINPGREQIDIWKARQGHFRFLLQTVSGPPAKSRRQIKRTGNLSIQRRMLSSSPLAIDSGIRTVFSATSKSISDLLKTSFIIIAIKQSE